jgi:phosphoglycolate phosphatase-like HAD superfamily hydrolase
LYPELLFVGDHEDDCKSGRRAGMRSALLTNGEDATEGSYTQRLLADEVKRCFIDFTVRDLGELAKVLEAGVVASAQNAVHSVQVEKLT